MVMAMVGVVGSDGGLTRVKRRGDWIGRCEWMNPPTSPSTIHICYLVVVVWAVPTGLQHAAKHHGITRMPNMVPQHVNMTWQVPGVKLPTIMYMRRSVIPTRANHAVLSQAIDQQALIKPIMPVNVSHHLQEASPNPHAAAVMLSLIISFDLYGTTPGPSLLHQTGTSRIDQYNIVFYLQVVTV